jgi:tripartite-type tricarboxylate transporter receptor subunit TctC
MPKGHFNLLRIERPSANGAISPRLMRLLALITICLSSLASAQNFPNKRVSLIVPFAPGASTDLIARYLADGLGKKWGQPVVTQNMPGAASAIGSAFVARSPADGQTMLFVSSSYSTNAATMPNLQFNPVTDLIPVAIAAVGQFVLTAGPSVKSTNLKDFLQEAKTREITYATTGAGSSVHFIGELFASATGIKMQAIHYKGAGEFMADLISGRVDVTFGSVTQAIPLVQSGQLKALAVTSNTRVHGLPDVPTLAESGITRDSMAQQWYGVFVPAGMSPAITAKINKDINEFMSSPATSQFLEKEGAYPDPLTVAQSMELVHGEIARWKKLAAERGIVLE